MARTIVVDGVQLTEEQTLLLASEVKSREKTLKTLSDLEEHMSDYEYTEREIIPGEKEIKLVNKKYYGPHYVIRKYPT